MPTFGTIFPWANSTTFSTYTTLRGEQVAAIGDFNGDGIVDFAISDPSFDGTYTYTRSVYSYTSFALGYTDHGAPYIINYGTYVTKTYTGTVQNTGAVAIVFGDGSGQPPQVDINALSPSQGFLIDGIDGGDRLGNAIAAAGDVNGDGYADVIIGARGINETYRGYGTGAGAGGAYVIFGAAAPVLDSDGKMELATLGADGNGLTVFGVDKSLIGSEVLNVGDFDGDGVDDIGIVAREGGGSYTLTTVGSYSTGYATYRNYDAGPGQLIILKGSDSGLPSYVDLGNLPADAIVLTNPGRYLSGGGTYSPYNETRFGESADGGGDFNNDGEADVIVGAPNLNVLTYSGYGNYYSAGGAYVFFGDAAAPGTTISTADLNGSNGFTFEGNQSGDRAGFSVASLGDINGDGFDDYIIGAPGADTSYTYTNVVPTYYGFISYSTYVPRMYSYAGYSGNGYGFYTSTGSGAYTYFGFGGFYTVVGGGYSTYTSGYAYTLFDTYTYTYNHYSTGQAYVVLGQAGRCPRRSPRTI